MKKSWFNEHTKRGKSITGATNSCKLLHGYLAERDTGRKMQIQRIAEQSPLKKRGKLPIPAQPYRRKIKITAERFPACFKFNRKLPGSGKPIEPVCCVPV